jgi:hypothetical protein
MSGFIVLLWPSLVGLLLSVGNSTSVDAEFTASGRSKGAASAIATTTCGDYLASACGDLKQPRLTSTSYDGAACSEDDGQWSCTVRCGGWCAAADEGE